MRTVADNLSAVKERIAKAAARVGRDPQDVTLVAVTETMPVKSIREAIDAGQRVFGENRVQEAQAKVQELGRDVQWHLIGHLQRNKVKFVLAVRSVRHGRIDRQPVFSAGSQRARAARHGLVMPILIQANIGDETTKSGVDAADTLPLVQQVAALSHVAVKGLMCVPPAVEIIRHARPVSLQLRTLAEQIERERIPNVSMARNCPWACRMISKWPSRKGQRWCESAQPYSAHALRKPLGASAPSFAERGLG